MRFCASEEGRSNSNAAGVVKSSLQDGVENLDVDMGVGVNVGWWVVGGGAVDAEWGYFGWGEARG